MNIRLSYSTLNSLHSCARKFQLDRLLEGAHVREESATLVFGKAFGVFVAEYLLTRDFEHSAYRAWMEYFPILEDPKRNQIYLFALMENSKSKLDNLSEEWEVAIFREKPAIELSFRLNGLANTPANDIYYVGYVDVVLKNRYSGRYAILEVKTTSLQLLNLAPLYQNSGQALGYSIILDQIAGEEKTNYDVIYFVGQFQGFSSTPTTFTFYKTLQDRLEWFISLHMHVKRIEDMLEMNIFPRNGGSCLQYNRPCFHFETCGLRDLDRYKKEEKDEIDYQFIYEIQEVVANHLSRIHSI
jgi:hypothetical protein